MPSVLILMLLGFQIAMRCGLGSRSNGARGFGLPDAQIQNRLRRPARSCTTLPGADFTRVAGFRLSQIARNRARWAHFGHSGAGVLKAPAARDGVVAGEKWPPYARRGATGATDHGRTEWQQINGQTLCCHGCAA